MNASEESIIRQEQEKELINILIDSRLYLELDLVERRKLLDFLAACYCSKAAST